MVATERPILFSGPMVRAILEGRKTQTRRVVKPQPTCVDRGRPFVEGHGQGGLGTRDRFLACPYGAPGDHLWVRETFIPEIEAGVPTGSFIYRATHEGAIAWGRPRWLPSIHMPREASRLTLEVTDVRAQRLQEISDDDAEAELPVLCPVCGDSNTNFLGDDTCPAECGGLSYREEFAALWDEINGKRAPWASNPWVWAITFKRLEATP